MQPPREPPFADDTEAERALEQWYGEDEDDYGDDESEFDPAEWIPF